MTADQRCRPQDRIRLDAAKESFRASLPDYVSDDEQPRSQSEESDSESFPASDPPAEHPNGDADKPRVHRQPADPGGRASHPTPVTLSDGTELELDHGAVVRGQGAERRDDLVGEIVDVQRLLRILGGGDPRTVEHVADQIAARLDGLHDAHVAMPRDEGVHEDPREVGADAATALDALRAWLLRPAAAAPPWLQLEGTEIRALRTAPADRRLWLECERLRSRETERFTLVAELFDRGANFLLFGPGDGQLANWSGRRPAPEPRAGHLAENDRSPPSSSGDTAVGLSSGADPAAAGDAASRQPFPGKY